ncbi:hypothetical protein OG562_43310 [Streptomyces sp. NBC_01275]|uniref:hypothetical protein n=1 Tax=Streptomyces sp. NBC_01275 TaxID=2903807 RepID=UPI002254C51A|nr:hypothetical protein [Streptomyces sp. NBC_01275]MCX4767670.1 hypothetical protein [Streptomyces sp. NBC_01275]
MSTSSATAGCTGATASGAGFTGSVPVAVPASSADYDATVAEISVSDTAVTAYDGVRGDLSGDQPTKRHEV